MPKSKLKKKEMVNKILQTLLYELDEETFNRLLPQALNQLSLDQETQSFYEYFKNIMSIKNSLGVGRTVTESMLA